MINFKNYMERIVDFYDGKLSQSETDALIAFLELNPELHEEFLLYGEAVPETADNESLKMPTFLHKQLKNIPDKIFVLTDELLIAYGENDLGTIDRRKTEKALELNPERKHDLEIINAARFKPDESIVFPYKNKLLKKKPVVIPFRRIFYYSTAAAVIILALFLRPAITNKSGMESGMHSYTDLILIKTANSTANNTQNNLSATPKTKIDYSKESFVSHSENNFQEENIAPLAPRVASQLKEFPVVCSASISETRSEYLAIFQIIEYKESLNVDNTPVTGTLTAWKDWGKGILSGESTIKNTPVDITLHDVATFSFTNISRIATENLSLSQWDR
jgi:hypothetical protein